MITRSYAAQSPGAQLAPWTFTRRDLGENDIAFDIAYSGICHSDIHQAREEWGSAIFPMVPGHEIVGTVTAIGSKVKNFALGDLIGVGVYVDSCRKCANCLNHLEQYCERGMIGTYNAFEADGKTPTYGGYSNNFVIDSHYALKVSASLDLAGVAPLLCAGITLYSPLKHWKAGPGKRVGIIGLGGLGHLGLKFAHALGADVTVFSHSPEKRESAIAMGADTFIVVDNYEVLTPLISTFDLVLNTVSAEINLDKYLQLLKLDGTLVVIGLPGKPYAINAGTLLGARRALAGSMVGGIEEIQEMLDFCSKHSIVSEVEIIQADYINEAYQRTIASDVKYRFVIDGSSF